MGLGPSPAMPPRPNPTPAAPQLPNGPFLVRAGRREVRAADAAELRNLLRAAPRGAEIEIIDLPTGRPVVIGGAEGVGSSSSASSSARSPSSQLDGFGTEEVKVLFRGFTSELEVVSSAAVVTGQSSGTRRAGRTPTPEPAAPRPRTSQRFPALRRGQPQERELPAPAQRGSRRALVIIILAALAMIAVFAALLLVHAAPRTPPRSAAPSEEPASPARETAPPPSPAAAVRSGPVAWYRFEDTENLGRDVSTLGNNGARQIAGMLAVVDAQRHHVAEFRGKGQMAVPCVVRKDFTIVFWLRTGFSGGDPYGNPEELQWRIGTGLVDGDMPNIAADFGVGLYAGRLLFGVGAPNTTLSGRQVVSDGTWHHVGVGRANGGEMRIYVDGQRDATMQGPPGERTAPDHLVVGSMTTGYGMLTGRLDELRFYDRLLTDAEVDEIYRVEHMGK